MELQNGLFEDAEGFTSSNQETLSLVDLRPSSPLSAVVPSSSPIRVSRFIKPLSKMERLERAVTAVKEGASARQAAGLCGVNRRTIRKRTESARSRAEFADVDSINQKKQACCNMMMIARTLDFHLIYRC